MALRDLLRNDELPGRLLLVVRVSARRLGLGLVVTSVGAVLLELRLDVPADLDVLLLHLLAQARVLAEHIRDGAVLRDAAVLAEHEREVRDGRGQSDVVRHQQDGAARDEVACECVVDDPLCGVDV